MVLISNTGGSEILGSYHFCCSENDEIPLRFAQLNFIIRTTILVVVFIPNFIPTHCISNTYTYILATRQPFITMTNSLLGKLSLLWDPNPQSIMGFRTQCTTSVQTNILRRHRDEGSQCQIESYIHVFICVLHVGMYVCLDVKWHMQK